MMRIIARHVAIALTPEPQRFCSWAREVARSEGAEGWAAAAGDGVEVWFEGTAPAVEAMIDWCASIIESPKEALCVTSQRPVLKGGFDVLDAPPGA